MGISLLLEGFSEEAHPRGYHGRWIGKPGGKVLRVFHGQAHLGDVTPGASRTHTMAGVGRVVGEAGRTISTGDIARVVDRAAGSPAPTPRVLAPGANANELRGGIPRLGAADRHGGFKVGDVVRYSTGSREAGGHGPVTMTQQPGLHTVVGLQRNGNLRVKHPDTGTTVDVPHQHAEKISPLHPDYRGKVVQDAYAAQKSVLAAEAAARAPRTTDFTQVRRQFESLAKGQHYPLHGGEGAIGHVVKTDAGFEVHVHGKLERTHKTPSSAAGHAVRLQRTALAQLPARQAARARRLQASAPTGVLGALLEGFVAAAAGPPKSWGGRFDVRDNVSVAVKGGEVTGRVLRASGARPDTHVIIDPGGGAAHVEAEVAKVRLHTPESYAASARRAEQAAASAGGPPGAGKGAGGAVREGVGVLLEGFAGPGALETPAQSQARGAKQVARAKQQLAAGWNASKHPRGRGGKFGYTTGGKRATRAHTATKRTVGQGAQGALVRSIQRQLGIPQDGVYGPNTKAAVVRFQQQHGLQVDGVVGRQTLAGLRGNANARSIAPGSISSKVATVRTHPSKRTRRAKVKGKAPVRIGGGVVV